MNPRSGSLLLTCLWMAILVAEAVPRKSNKETISKDTEPGITCPCGEAKKGRIIGGKATAVNEYPWIVMLTKTVELTPFCGVSIINEKVVITAAHCTHDEPDDEYSVMAGTSDLRNPGQIVAVVKIIEHEDYEHPPGYAFRTINDIALLFLEYPLKFNEYTSPICLPHGKMDLNDKWIKILGWGKMGGEENSSSSYNLLEVDVEVVPHEKCKSKFWSALTTPQTQICGLAPGKGACMGDSGGPVVYLDPKINRYILVGLVSFGDGNCDTNLPTVSTEVSEFLPWIKSKLNTLGCQRVKTEEEENNEKKINTIDDKEEGNTEEEDEDTKEASKGSKEASNDIKDTENDPKKSEKDLKEAEKDLKEAEKDLKEAEKEVKKAEDEVNTAKRNKEGSKKIMEKVKILKEKTIMLKEKAKVVREKAKKVHEIAVKNKGKHK